MVLGLAKVGIIERWLSWRVATIDRFHCTKEARYMYSYIEKRLIKQHNRTQQKY